MQDWEDKIAKLLMKAERAGTTEEAEAFTDAAERLMIKHGIEQAIIDARRAKDGKEHEKIITMQVPVDGIYSDAFMMMIHRVCSTLEVVQMWQSRGQGTHRVAHIAGFEGDVKQTVTLITSLILQAASAQRKWWATFPSAGLSGMGKFKERRDFLYGFGRGVQQRLRTARSETVSSSGTGAELVLVDRSKQVVAWVNSNVRLRTSRSRTTSGGGFGLAAGKTAGLNANTGGRAVGGGGRLAVGR